MMKRYRHWQKLTAKLTASSPTAVKFLGSCFKNGGEEENEEALVLSFPQKVLLGYHYEHGIEATSAVNRPGGCLCLLW